MSIVPSPARLIDSKPISGAAALRHQVHQRRIAADQAGRKAEPAHFQRDQRGEQLARIGDVGNQVEVDEQDVACADPADVLDHMRDRLLELLASPRRRGDAEFAVVGTRPGRLEHRLGQVVALVEQLAAGEGQVGELEVRPLFVARLHRAAREIAQQSRPALLGIADADRVGVGLRLVGLQGDVRPAEHDGAPALAEFAREFIGAGRAAGDHGHADEIGVDVERTSRVPSSYSANSGSSSGGTKAASVVRVSGW